MSASEPDDRRARGRKVLTEIHGPVGEEVVARLAKIAPDFADHLVDYAFGDVYARPGLDRRSRQIATVAALAALGNAEQQLKWHIRGALNIGISSDEIVEILMQMAIYGGFPAAVRALTAAGEVFDEVGVEAAEEAIQDDA
ncbi:carboxymuconolactone decarboxylase family protein [Methylopila sp. M107]|uniref:carboxymuconolactone decarboxylase family protein n=1 Tax=Methylopila sp. M107 TaxID=1101190 RepID=UPI0003771F75|nr:carboxymuconolactone decarboxylase family protein [Methylopila sp. M107]